MAIIRNIFLVSDITLQTLKEFIPNFLRNIYIECLLTGNLAHEEALDIAGKVEEILIVENQTRAMLPIQHMVSREYQLPEGSYFYHFFINTLH